MEYLKLEYSKNNSANTVALLNKTFSEKLSDYHVFVFPSTDDGEPKELFEFQVFFDKDITDISVEELKKLIKDSFN